MIEKQDQGPCYAFDASYVYGKGERYSSGRGLSVMSHDLAAQEALFERMKNGDEPYALELRRCDTGEVLRSHGDMRAAIRSMWAAA